MLWNFKEVKFEICLEEAFPNQISALETSVRLSACAFRVLTRIDTFGQWRSDALELAYYLIKRGKLLGKQCRYSHGGPGSCQGVKVGREEVMEGKGKINVACAHYGSVIQVKE